MTDLIIKGRKGLLIAFKCPNPDELIGKKSLLELDCEAIKEALNKPFIVLEDINIFIEYKDKMYNFTIPKGYDWNGANVPPFAWVIIGQRTDPRFMLASCVHDYMCEHHEVVENNRYLSTLIFETLCLHFGKFNAIKRWAMFHSVDNFQKVFGKDLNKRKWEK